MFEIKDETSGEMEHWEEGYKGISRVYKQVESPSNIAISQQTAPMIRELRRVV